MSRWLDAFRKASVRKAAPVQLAQLGADSPPETPNCTFPTYPHQGKGRENEVPEPQGADGAAEPEGSPRGADNSPYGWGDAAEASRRLKSSLCDGFSAVVDSSRTATGA